MEAIWFAWINAALFAVQVAVNIAYAKDFVTLAREYETLIAPASFALGIWILIYALEAVLVLTDVLYLQSSLNADATQPIRLRACFGITCIANALWLILFVMHHVYAATVMIYVLWLALLMLYIYSVRDRNAGGWMDWRRYDCNKLLIAIYFAWVSAIAFNHLAIALQFSRHSYLSVVTYVVYLVIVITFALMAVLYAKDLVFGLVAIWYLISVAVKDVRMPPPIRCADMSVRACAGEGAAIIAVLIILTTLSVLLNDSDPRETPTTTNASGMAIVQGHGASNYGSTA